MLAPLSFEGMPDMMHRVQIIRRTEAVGKVWQGGTVHMVDDATLQRLIDAGAVEIKMEAGAPENKAEAPPVKRKRGRPRKVQP